MSMLPENFPFDDPTLIYKVTPEEIETNPKWGTTPTNRTVSELLNFGVINLDKPPNLTSHEVSAYISKILNVEKVAHGGTLDPGVTGVLPIALGKATPIARTWLTSDKEYVVVMRLHGDIELNRILEVFREFTGPIYQRPPIRSAVARRTRIRKIYEIKFLEMKDKDVLFKVKCQAGTYIRKLCVSGDTEIILADGKIVKIKDLIDKNASDLILGFDLGSNNVNYFRISKKFKLNAPEKLYEITTESGLKIVVTPDHEILVSDFNGPKWVEARDLKVGDWIFSVRKIEILNEERPYIFDFLSDDVNVYIDDPKLLEDLALDSAPTSIDSSTMILSSKNNRIRLGVLRQQGEIWFKNRDRVNAFIFNDSIFRISSSKITENLAYILGLISLKLDPRKINNSYIRFRSKHMELIKSFIIKYKKTFPGIGYVAYNKKGIFYEVYVNNPLLSAIIKGLLVDENSIELKKIFKFPKMLLIRFLNGVFDCCGFVIKSKDSITKVGFSVNKYQMAKRILLLLKRIGIRGRIHQQNSSGKISIFIESGFDITYFLNLVEVNNPILKDALFKSNLPKSCENEDLLPLHIKKILLRLLGDSVSTIDEETRSKINESLPISRNILGKILHKIYKVYPDNEHYSHLEVIYKSPIFIEKIQNIRVIKSKESYVYDISVDYAHNFIPEAALVISNCTDIGDVLGVGAHMIDLRRIKSGPFREDEKMRKMTDIIDAWEIYKESGDDTLLRNTIFPAELGVTHIPRIIVNDGAVGAITYGAPLYIPGIVAFSKNIKEGDIIAILTIKGELVALGESILDAQKIMKKEKGQVTRDTRVLMPKDIYPPLWKK